MFEEVKRVVTEAHTIVIIQAENPDGDSLGSALALEEILEDQGKKVHLYCPVIIPKYLRYAKGWDRVSDEWPMNFDAAIIVDTASATLLDRALIPEQLGKLKQVPVLVFDHHVTPGDLPLKTIDIIDTTVVATGELLYKVASTLSWPINAAAAEHLIISILSDSLGLTSSATKVSSIRAVADLVEIGASLNDIENRRRAFMKKTPEILAYKGQLLQRIEYYLDGQLALVHIPWEEIESYSDKYNPSMLVIDEMRLVEGVRVAVALKTYPDGKVTAKLRANTDAYIANVVGGYFGGGGHPYAAGFRTYEHYETVKSELVQAVEKALKDHDNDAI